MGSAYKLSEPKAASAVTAEDQLAKPERRSFLAAASTYGFAVPPTMALLLSTTMNSPAIAVSGQGVTPGNGNGNSNGGGGGGGGGGGDGGSSGAQGSGGGVQGFNGNAGPGGVSGPGGGGASLTQPSEGVLGAAPSPIEVFDTGAPAAAPGAGNLGAGAKPPSRVSLDDILGAGERG